MYYETTKDAADVERLGSAAAIAAALRTGLLAELSTTTGPVTDAELAQRLGLDLRATRLVLALLATLQLVRRDGAQVAPGEALLASGKLPGGYATVFGMWAHTEEFLRSGEPFVLMDQGAKEREHIYRDVVAGLARLFEQPARDLAAQFPLRPKQILDAGCGSGVWSLALAERFEDAEVTGLDLPGVLESFAARAAKLSLTSRTRSLPGDLNVAEIPAGAFDLVIIANVLRLDAPARAENILRRVAKGVAPAGALLVVDALAGGTPERERARACYELNLGLRTRTGQVHSPETISQWLAQAGLPRVRAIDIANGAGGLGGLLATTN